MNELQQNLKLETASREHLFAQFDQKILENSQAFHGKMLEFERQKLEYDSYFQKINEARALQQQLQEETLQLGAENAQLKEQTMNL